MRIDPGLSLIKECTELMTKALREFEKSIGVPEFSGESGKERFRYKRPGAKAFQVIKGARVISTYNACICLLAQGYGQETCALLRTIFEFLNDMDFIAEAFIKGGISAQQQKMLDLFFEEDLPVPEELMDRHSKKPTISRKKVHAEIARGLSPGNSDYTQRLIRVLEEVYSGYIHGAYPHIMELYTGGVWMFSVDGMPNSPRPAEAMRATVRSLSQALNQFARIAAIFGKAELFNTLIEKRKQIEVSPFYGKGAG